MEPCPFCVIIKQCNCFAELHHIKVIKYIKYELSLCFMFHVSFRVTKNSKALWAVVHLSVTLLFMFSQTDHSTTLPHNQHCGTHKHTHSHAHTNTHTLMQMWLLSYIFRLFVGESLKAFVATVVSSEVFEPWNDTGYGEKCWPWKCMI